MPVPEDRGLHGDERPRVHRFRSRDVKLVERIRVFRKLHDLTQAEVAAVVGGGSGSTVTQWERGVHVPDGIRRERALALVDGHLWPELRSAVVNPPGMPLRWLEAVRWYRRASRETRRRQSIGAVIAFMLDGLRGFATVDELRHRYGADSLAWAESLLPDFQTDLRVTESRRRAEDGAFGLRWLELAKSIQFDLSRSLVPQISLDIVPIVKDRE